MRIAPEIFWEEETPQSKRLNFIIIKFGASTACVDEGRAEERIKLMNKERATVYDLWRICKYYDGFCNDCPLKTGGCTFCSNVSLKGVDEINELILKWCKEHPVKTRQDKFLEHYPHARAKKIGVLDICPKIIDIRVQCMSELGLSCPDCQKSYWLAEVEENE